MLRTRKGAKGSSLLVSGNDIGSVQKLLFGSGWVKTVGMEPPPPFPSPSFLPHPLRRKSVGKGTVNAVVAWGEGWDVKNAVLDLSLSFFFIKPIVINLRITIQYCFESHMLYN
jgi:hypothetical protein